MVRDASGFRLRRSDHPSCLSFARDVRPGGPRTMVRTLTAPVPLRLRPLEIGDLLDETFRMYRRHFFLFAGISVILAIPLAALAGYGFLTIFNSLLQLQTTPGQAPDFSTLIPSLTAFGVGFLINLALYPFLYGAVTYAVCESAFGRPVTIWGALAGVSRRYF